LDGENEMPAIWWHHGEVVEERSTFKDFFLMSVGFLEQEVLRYGG
jgi:hypothetical protein